MEDMQGIKQNEVDEQRVFDDGTGVEKEAEENGSDGRITAPFDPTLIRINSQAMTINLLVSRIKHEEIVQPGFQRKAGIWSDGTQSRLIESILIRIPLPAFYIDATDDEEWLIVDGLQRITTLKRFLVTKELKLRELEFLGQLDGKTYDELPRNLQRRIDETQVTIYLIEKGSPTDVKFNIFKRINTEGLPLSEQEIRHALYQGKATNLLDELANSLEFKDATDKGIKDDRMADRESILRFLAFTIRSYLDYGRKEEDSQDLATFLNHTMKAINEMSEPQIQLLIQQFKRTMLAASNIFGKDAFRKRFKAGASRSPINKALFECWSVTLCSLNDEHLRLLEDKKDLLRDKFMHLLNTDSDFVQAISISTGNARKVRKRFETISHLVKEVLYA